jgi:hypothetical protein
MKRYLEFVPILPAGQLDIISYTVIGESNVRYPIQASAIGFPAVICLPNCAPSLLSCTDLALRSNACVLLAMSLASLPTELIECIAAYLNRSDTCSLRLTSSSLKQQSLHVFRDRFFRKRSVSWTRQSLDRLVEISEHAGFGSALQHLHIDATPRHSILLWQLRKPLFEASAFFSELDDVLFKSELQELYVEKEKEAKAVATFFNETRYDQKCLRAVFSRVQSLESIVFRYEGMDKDYGKFVRRYCESSQHEMSRPFISTMAVVAASGIHVRRITVDPSNAYGAVSVGRLESLAPSLRSFETIFESLEELDLNLRDWRCPEEGFELENARAPFLVRFLAKARNLRHLSIGCYSILHNDLVGEMARHCVFPYLETCQLSHFRLRTASDLINFLGPSSVRLTSLTLSHIILIDDDVGWPDLLRHLASSQDALQALEWMRLIKLFTKTGARLGLNGGMGQEELLLGTPASGKAITTWRADLWESIGSFSEGSWGPSLAFVAGVYPFIGMRT